VVGRGVGGTRAGTEWRPVRATGEWHVRLLVIRMCWSHPKVRAFERLKRPGIWRFGGEDASDIQQSRLAQS